MKLIALFTRTHRTEVLQFFVLLALPFKSINQCIVLLYILIVVVVVSFIKTINSTLPIFWQMEEYANYFEIALKQEHN